MVCISVSGEKCAKFSTLACNREGLVGDSLVHIDSSLSKSICKQMKDFQQTKKLQPELKDKLEFAAGDKECSWYHWQKCRKFTCQFYCIDVQFRVILSI